MKYLFAIGTLFLFLQFTPNETSLTETKVQTIKTEKEGIQFFKGSLEEAKALAKEEKKMIFIDAYTTWCGPCKMMASHTFTDPKVGEFFNENYINLKVDMERGIGPKMASKYAVTAYPTLLIIDEGGNLMSKTIGFQNADQLIKFGKKYEK